MIVRSIRYLVVLTCAAPAFASNVWIVDAAMGPGAHFSDIPAAVIAASSGDVVLVRSGAYTGFVISGKALAVCADAGAVVTLSPAASGVAVVAPANAQVWVHGTTGGRLIVQSGSGRVLVSDGSFVGPNPVVPAIEVLNNAPVILDHVQGTGGAGAGVASGGFGLRTGFADVVAYESTFTGGAGLNASAGAPATAGGAGAFAYISTSLQLSNCTVQGGKGGDGFFATSCVAPGAGGAGASSANGSSLFVSNCAIAGGAGGSAATGCGANGADGPGISGPSTTLVQRPTLDVMTVVREGQQGSVQTSTLPGLNAVLIGSLQAFQPVPPFHGLLHVADPVLMVTMPPSGFVSYTVSELGAGVPFALLRAQAVHADPTTQSVEFGQTCGVLLLDSAY